VLDGAVRRALDRADGTRPVVAHSGVPPHAPQLDGTDSHLYYGWYRRDIRDLGAVARALPRLVRFVSELGAQAVPSGEGAAVCEPERWPDLDWDGLAARHGLQPAVLRARVPTEGHATFASWQDATQRYQAELIRRQIEVLRRLKYRPTGGFAQFFLADGHPAVSFSVLDDERRPKRGWDALRAACRPVIVVADRLPPAPTPGTAVALDVHVVSDRRTPVEGAEVSAQLSWDGGEHRWRWGGDLPADACVRVGTMQLVVPDASGRLALRLRLALPDGEIVDNHDEVVIGPAGAAPVPSTPSGDGPGGRAPR
jgi:beta-mannosidase